MGIPRRVPRRMARRDPAARWGLARRRAKCRRVFRDLELGAESGTWALGTRVLNRRREPRTSSNPFMIAWPPPGEPWTPLGDP